MLTLVPQFVLQHAAAVADSRFARAARAMQNGFWSSDFTKATGGRQAPACRQYQRRRRRGTIITWVAAGDRDRGKLRQTDRCILARNAGSTSGLVVDLSISTSFVSVADLGAAAAAIKKDVVGVGKGYSRDVSKGGGGGRWTQGKGQASPESGTGLCNADAEVV